MNLKDKVWVYALKKADMTEEELHKSLNHDAGCRCVPCQKFDRYLNIKEIITEWENHKEKK